MRRSPAPLAPLVAAFVVALGCESTPPVKHGKSPATHIVPGCVHGTFAEELDRHIPPMTPVHPVAVFASPKLDASIEPGCVLPFRDKPGVDQTIDVGRVVARLGKRKIGALPNALKPKVVGHGTLKLGRNELALSVHDDAGDENLGIDVKGTHVVLRQKKVDPVTLEVDVAADDPLPLPFDALIEALSPCDADDRVAATEDGDIVEAKRSGVALWRSRYVTLERATIIDTSVLCDTNDARLAWRTAVGDIIPMVVVISKRSEMVLIIERETPSWTEDSTDPGMGGVGPN
jgi:hypothetical protein